MTSLSYNVDSNHAYRMPNGNMDDHSADEGTRAEPEPLSNTTEIKTSDVYKVDKNLPARFNNPECFRGYR